MPDGVVQWFDSATGEAAIVRGSHVFRAAAAEIDPVARHPGARVHFDIQRDHGAERAVDVTLRAGTRTSPHQRHFGALTGAHRPDTKGAAPFARPHPERGRMLAAHPMEVARAWVDCLQASDADGALSLYASDAMVHTDAGDRLGRAHLATWLEATGLLGITAEPVIRGEDNRVVLSWDRVRAAPLVLRCRVEHGLIAEQWLARVGAQPRPLEVPSATAPVAVSVTTRGDVDEGAVAYALGRLADAFGHIDDPILFARLKLTQAADPARKRPAIAQVEVDINGALVRAHVAGHDMREAADLLQRHLGDKLEQRAQHRDALRGRSGVPEPGEWRHGDLPTLRPEYLERPAEEREVVRHKSFAPGELTPDEAAFDMTQLDYDFHLFRDLASGEDTVMERLPGGTFRMNRLHPSAVDSGPVAISLAVTDAEPPQLTVKDAVERMNADGERFLFFANTTTGRGNLIYHRYDGHYGLIVPA